jgi:hypothetical protein
MPVLKNISVKRLVLACFHLIFTSSFNDDRLDDVADLLLSDERGSSAEAASNGLGQVNDGPFDIRGVKGHPIGPQGPRPALLPARSERRPGNELSELA